MAPRSTRRERERQRHRREVLSAALNLFSRRGFEKTTMADIAEQAEFAVGTLYTLFKDKDTLYRALILDTVERSAQVLTLVLKAPGSEIEKLERYIETKAACSRRTSRPPASTSRRQRGQGSFRRRGSIGRRARSTNRS